MGKVRWLLWQPKPTFIQIRRAVSTKQESIKKMLKFCNLKEIGTWSWVNPKGSIYNKKLRKGDENGNSKPLKQSCKVRFQRVIKSRSKKMWMLTIWQASCCLSERPVKIITPAISSLGSRPTETARSKMWLRHAFWLMNFWTSPNLPKSEIRSQNLNRTERVSELPTKAFSIENSCTNRE